MANINKAKETVLDYSALNMDLAAKKVFSLILNTSQVTERLTFDVWPPKWNQFIVCPKLEDFVLQCSWDRIEKKKMGQTDGWTTRKHDSSGHSHHWCGSIKYYDLGLILKKALSTCTWIFLKASSSVPLCSSKKSSQQKHCSQKKRGKKKALHIKGKKHLLSTPTSGRHGQTLFYLIYYILFEHEHKRNILGAGCFFPSSCVTLHTRTDPAVLATDWL